MISPRRIEEELRKLLFLTLKLFIKNEVVSDINKNSIKNILIVRQHNEVGDMLLTTPMFHNLRESFKDAYISLVARPVNIDVVKFNPDINEVILYDSNYLKRFPWKIVVFLKKIRERKYDLVIVPCTVAFSLTSALIAYFSRAKIRIGCDGSKFGVYKQSDIFFNKIIQFEKEPKHQVDVNMDFIKPLNIGITYRKHIMGVSDDDVKFADNLFNKYKLDKKRKIIAVHPGAGKLPNRWNFKNFAAVADYCIDKLNSQLILIVGPKEEELKNNVLGNMHNVPVILPQLSILQVAAIIKSCDLLVCNDTGILHVGAGVGAPTVAIFGPSDPSYWNPIGEEHIAIRGKDNICDNVAVVDVIAAVEKLIKA